MKSGTPGKPARASVLVQPEMERGRSPLLRFRPVGGDFQGKGVFRSDETRLGSAEVKPPRSAHRLDEATGLTFSMVASPQWSFRFARQNYCTAATASGLKFLADTPQNSRE